MTKKIQKIYKKRRDNKNNMPIRKKGEYRWEWGDLDLISAILVIIGVYLISKNFDFGWIITILGVLKQFSGR
ncbi:MAG: hypothetical protein KJ623_00890 [Nanoarchaeota archaeon]|nr:hypothetical protein [Nanoarchaeota archaeon]MBU0962804.1 hypothetical protein [Nanoarchaeota archaeon]